MRGLGEARLPAIYQWPETAEEGGLIAYGPSLHGAFRQVTTLVVKLLQGRKPGDLPVEQPTRFSLSLNLRTARSLDLVIPRSCWSAPTRRSSDRPIGAVTGWRGGSAS
jgi:ABC-type uncharacterized transport system substrate-binding protein